MTPQMAAEKQPKRDPQVWAGKCPKCGTKGKVRRTMRLVRYCYCKCGHSWLKVAG